MRVAIVTESFLPTLNGVTTSVCRVVDELAARGHEVLIVAPAPAPARYPGGAVSPVRSVPIRQFPVGLPSRAIEPVLRDFGPDVVHVASPFVLGARGLTAARNLALPTVAVYQTDMPSYLAQHAGPAGSALGRASWRWLRWIHDLADLTLAPSRSALADLERNGIARCRVWARGVDTQLFGPRWGQDAGCRALRRSLAPNGEILVGYVGRLAPEKELHRLTQLSDLAGVRLVLTGDGPSRGELTALLPEAVFLGRREADDLARVYAALDVFVHTGTRETFGQTIQEAAASALPVIAPARGGPLDLVEHERTGLLFDPDREDGPTSLYSMVQRLTTADDAWQHRALLGHAAAAQVAARSWSSLVDELLTHYAAAREARLAAQNS